MNDYFDYIDIDSSFMPAYPNDDVYKKTNIQKKIYPSKLQDILDLQNKMQGQNTINNMTNINDSCGLLNSTEGTLRGNMFPNMYDPYKNEEPKRFVPTSERERQLFDVQKAGFAMMDINLYLDVHPNDSCMINLYNRYLNEYERLLSNYESQYGPITLDSKTLDTIPWAWNQTKWPWEGGN